MVFIEFALLLPAGIIALRERKVNEEVTNSSGSVVSVVILILKMDS